MQPLMLSKDCSQFSGVVPSLCTVLNPAFMSSNVVLDSGAGDTAMEPGRYFSVVDRLPDDYPIGVGAIITPVFVERLKDLSDRTLLAFLVDYPPGASADLHGMPSSGYVMVHILSGTIHALRGMQVSASITQERRGCSLLLPPASRPQIRVTRTQLEHSLFS
jgi:hypothetical protein